MPWVNKAGEEVSYYEVKAFYKQLKRKDLTKTKAEKFLKLNEEEYKPSPPYQYIREYIKDHQNTKELVTSLKTDDSVIYFSSIDSDTKRFNGIYSSYLRIIAQSKDFPTVMSTGYEFAEEYDGFPLHVGSKLERIIRIVTAETLSGGVYYPEPNFCVLIPNDKNTLPYSFIDKKITVSNLESPVLLRQILQDPHCILIFSNDNPLITSGDRAKKSEPQFSETFQNGEAPNDDDLAKLSQIIQSTANPRDWAMGVYYNRSFKIEGGHKGVVGFFRKYIDDLFKDNNIQNALSELKKIVTPSKIVDSLYEAVQNVKSILDKFRQPFEESEILDDDLYNKLLVQFYELSSNAMLTIIRIDEIDELYRAVNAGYSLNEICRIYRDINKFKAIFSTKAKTINEANDGDFEEITFQDLEELFDAIIRLEGTVEDFEELLNDANKLFDGKYGDTDFNTITSTFLNSLQSIASKTDDDTNDYEENNSAYEKTVEHFAYQFEKEYGTAQDYEEEDHEENTPYDNSSESLIYPEDSHEYFQQSILNYGSRLHNLGIDIDVIAASNFVPGARTKIINKLTVLHEESKKKNNSDDEIFSLVDLFPEVFKLSPAQIESLEQEKIIKGQIVAVESLKDLLLSSLDSVPDHEILNSGESSNYPDYSSEG
jgi:arsenate reductase-like glutaredoxin family protein